MNMVKMKKIFSDEKFVKSLFEMETAAEVQAALKEKEIELTEEEILSIRDLLVKMDNGELPQEQMEKLQVMTGSGELSEEELENIAGGSVTLMLVTALGGIAIKVGLGTAAGIAVGLGVSEAVNNRW